jgi:hypothetical protein
VTHPPLPYPPLAHRPADRPRRAWRLLVVALGTVALLGTCGLGAVLVLADGRQGLDPGGPRAAAQVVRPRDISSRAVDPAPLTVAEVFGAGPVDVAWGRPGFQVLATEDSPDCARATAGAVQDLLKTLGCHQVVRATMRSPGGGYLVTAGILNLDDEADAVRAYDGIKAVAGIRTGRFTGLDAGPGSEPVTSTGVQSGWHWRGHYLVFCVVARTDGQPVATGDQTAGQVLFDVVEHYLRGEVLQRRTRPASPGG